MYRVVGYHRPTSLAEVLQLLAAGDCVALAGGVHLRHDVSGLRAEVVDLQAARLDRIESVETTVTIGANVRLQALVDEPDLPELVRKAAQFEQPSTLRTQATVGGAIATAFGDSMLLAAMLVHDTVVRLASHDRGERSVGLVDLLAAGRDRSELIVAATLSTGGTVAMARTGRTPRDRPIVGVVGRRVTGAAGDRTMLAACGVGPVPVLIEPDGIASLRAIDDHRASAAYRLHLARVLADRVSGDLS